MWRLMLTLAYYTDGSCTTQDWDVQEIYGAINDTLSTTLVNDPTTLVIPAVCDGDSEEHYTVYLNSPVTLGTLDDNIGLFVLNPGLALNISNATCQEDLLRSEYGTPFLPSNATTFSILATVTTRDYCESGAIPVAPPPPPSGVVVLDNRCHREGCDAGVRGALIFIGVVLLVVFVGGVGVIVYQGMTQ
jgi:hypothetical protein